MTIDATASLALAALALVAGCGAKSGLVDRAPEGSEKRDGGPAIDCTDPDGDRDGHLAIACGGDDCDDGRADVHPGAQEVSEWVVEEVLDCTEPAVKRCPHVTDLGFHEVSGPVVAFGLSETTDEDQVIWIAERVAGVWVAEPTELRFLIGIELSAGELYILGRWRPDARDPDRSRRVVFLTRDANGWATEVLGDVVTACNGVGGACGDVAWSPDGYLHAIFPCENGTDVEVCHAERISADWTVETIGPAPNTSDIVDVIATDGIVRACVGALEFTVGEDRYYQRGVDGWTWEDSALCHHLVVADAGTVQVVGSGYGSVGFYGVDPGHDLQLSELGGVTFCGAAVDANGHLLTVAYNYLDEDEDDPSASSPALFMSLAILEDGRWRFDTFDETFGRPNSEIIVAGDTVHIAYRAHAVEGDSVIPLGIRYATRTPAAGIDNDCDGGER